MIKSLVEFKEKNLEIITQIKEIIKEYEYTDSHFKIAIFFVKLFLTNLRKELIKRYDYTEKIVIVKIDYVEY